MEINFEALDTTLAKPQDNTRIDCEELGLRLQTGFRVSRITIWKVRGEILGYVKTILFFTSWKIINLIMRIRGAPFNHVPTQSLHIILTHWGRGHLNCLNARSRGFFFNNFNPFIAELNRICSLLALLTHHFLHVSRIRVKSLIPRLLMSYIYIYIYIYIYGAPILDVSRSHTTTQHSR